MNTNQRVYTVLNSFFSETSAALSRGLMSLVLLCRGITRSRFANWLIVSTQTMSCGDRHSNANTTAAFA